MSPSDAAKLDEIRERLKARGKGCGECTACCTLMRVDMAPIAPTHKPERTKCTHECKAGCSIYENKPDSCSAFMCLWLATQMFDAPMPARWRPDRIGGVVDVNAVGNMTIHLKHEAAFERTGPLRDMIKALLRVDTELYNTAFAILDRPSGNHLLFQRNGITQELVPCGVGEDGIKQYRTKFPGEA